MTIKLPSNGTISLVNVADNLELARAIELGSPKVRALAGKKTGDITLSDLYDANEVESNLLVGTDGTSRGFYATYWGELKPNTFLGNTVSGVYDGQPNNRFVFIVDGNKSATATFRSLIINEKIYYASDATFEYQAGSDNSVWVWENAHAGLEVGKVYELSYCTGPEITGAPTPAPAKPMPYGVSGDFSLTFEDEFTSSLDTSKWNRSIWYETPAEDNGGVKNWTVEDGKLKIWPDTGYVNRTIDTDGKFSQKYGYFEVKAKLPRGKGTNPSFWLFAHPLNDRPKVSVFKAFPAGTVVTTTTTSTDPIGIEWYCDQMSAILGGAKGTTSTTQANPTLAATFDTNSDSVYVTTLKYVAWTSAYKLRNGLSGVTAFSTQMADSTAKIVVLAVGWADRYESRTVDQLKDDMRSLIDTARNASTPKYVIIQIGNETDDNSWHSHKQGILDVAAEKGVQVIDQFTYTKNYRESKGYSIYDLVTDGRWGNQAHHDRMGKYAAARFKEILAADSNCPRAATTTTTSSGGGNWGTADFKPTDYKAEGVASDTSLIGFRRGSDSVTMPNLDDAYHYYGVKWESDGLTFYFDGTQIGTKVATTKLQSHPMYLLLSLWFESDAALAPNTTDTPRGKTNSLEVEYVRAWKFGTDAAPAPTYSTYHYEYNIAYDDLGGGSTRCELTWDPWTVGYNLGQEYWQAFRIRIGSNIKNSPADDETLIWQVHDNNNLGVSLNPIMAMVAFGGGANAKIQVQLRYNSIYPPDKANQVTRYVLDFPYEADRTYTIVLNFKMHHSTGNGAFFNMWIDGAKVVTDTLPNDYNVGQDSDSTLRSYQKLGLYHYYPNTWSSGSVRSAQYTTFFTIIDDGNITESMMRTAAIGNSLAGLPSSYHRLDPSLSYANGIDAFRLQVMGVNHDDIAGLEASGGYWGSGGRYNFRRVEVVSTPTPTPTPTPVPGETTPVPTPAPTPVNEANTYIPPLGHSQDKYPKMTFRDEFNGVALDTTRWNTAAWHTDPAPNGTTNIKVQNGSLHLWPVTPFVNMNAHVDTDGKFYQRYGYFEVRAKLPKGRGLQPALWLHNHELTDIRPEIEVMTAYPGADKSRGWDYGNDQLEPQAYISEVWGKYPSVTGFLVGTRRSRDWVGYQDLYNTFHTYGCHWDRDGVQLFFDGVALGSKINYLPSNRADLRMQINLSLLAPSNTISGTPNESETPTGIENSMVIDYVRAWELADGSTRVFTTIENPEKSTGATEGTQPTRSRYYSGYYPSNLGNLISVEEYYTHVLLCHAQPNFSWGGLNGNSWTGTGLQFTDSPGTIKSRIKSLQDKGIHVLLSIGGPSHTTTTAYADLAAAAGVAATVKTEIKEFIAEFALDGVDLDYRVVGTDATTLDNYAKVVQALREAVSESGSTKVLSVAGDPVGGDCTAATTGHPYCSGRSSSHTTGNAGRERLLFKDKTASGGSFAGKPIGELVDIVNVRSYDMGVASYDPVTAYNNYRDLVLASTVVSIGMQVPAESAGGAILMPTIVDAGCAAATITADQYGTANPGTYSVERFINYLKTRQTNASDGLALWHMLKKVSGATCGGKAGATTVTIGALVNGTSGAPTQTAPTGDVKIVEFYGNSTLWGYKTGTGGRVATSPVQAFANKLPTIDARNMAINSTSSQHWIDGTNGVPNPWSTTMAQSPARYVVIGHGTLDIFERTVEQFKQNLKTMITTARNYGKVPVVMTPAIVDYSSIAGYAAAARDAAAETSAMVLDVYTHTLGIVTSGSGRIRDYVPDGIHPSDQLYIEMGNYMADKWPSLVAIVESTPTPAPAPKPAPDPEPAPSPAPTPAPSPVNTNLLPAVPSGHPHRYELIFNEEFNGSDLNRNIWNTHIWYDSREEGVDNWRVSNGELHFFPTREFRKRTIDTDGKWYAGPNTYHEIEAKLPRGRGCWPAYWLFNHDHNDGGGNDRPEIDIMEAYPGGGYSSWWSDSNLNPINYGMTLWRENSNNANNHIASLKLRDFDPWKSGVRLDNSYHKYGCLWESSGITFFFDGQQVGSKVNTSFFSMRMYILLDLWYGSASGTPNTSETPLGMTNAYSVRYVRVWRKL